MVRRSTGAASTVATRLDSLGASESSPPVSQGETRTMAQRNADRAAQELTRNREAAAQRINAAQRYQQRQLAHWREIQARVTAANIAHHEEFMRRVHGS